MAKLLNSPELALLVAATARPPMDHHRAAIAAAAEPGRIDWSHFVHLIDRHRVAPLVFDALSGLRDVIPDGAFAELRAKAMRDRTQALQTIGVLAIVQARLADAGIEAVSIKGPTLAQLAFGDPTVRQCRDLDVLVPAHAIVSALTALEALDCYPIDKTQLGDPNYRASLMQITKDVSLFHVPSGTIIEIHWRLTNNPHLMPNNESISPQSVSIGGVITKTLSSDHLLIYLAVHGIKHHWFRIKWLADVYALLSQCSNDELLVLFKQAKDQGLAIPVGQALLVLEAVYGFPLPDALRRKAQQSWRTRFLTRVALTYIAEIREPEDKRSVMYAMLLRQTLFRSEPGYIASEIAGFLIDGPTLLRLGGTRFGYLVAIIGRPFFWIARRITASRLINNG